jgi:hypothetical protein
MDAECRKREQSGTENPVEGPSHAFWGLFCGSLSKVIINPRLFHNTVGHMPDPYLPIHRDIPQGDGTMPYIVIPLTMPHKITSMVS